jgi:hypothetical protein
MGVYLAHEVDSPMFGALSAKQASRALARARTLLNSDFNRFI